MYKLAKFTSIKTALTSQQTRYLTSSCSLFTKKNIDITKEKVDDAGSLMQNAPDWNEKLATESEADIKAEREPNTQPEVLEEETAEWVKSHKK